MELADLLQPDDTQDDNLALIEALRQQREQQAEERAGLRETLQRQQGQAGNLRTLSLLSSLGANPLLQGIRQTAGEQGGQLEALSARTEQRLASSGGGLNPLALARLNLSALAPKLRAEEAEKARRFRALEAEKNRQNARSVAAITAGDKATQQQLENEAGLRKELLGNKLIQEYQAAAVAYGKVRAAAADPTPAGDLALIFGYMKTLDPTSAVREGEFANAQNAAGVPDRIRNAYNQVASGNRLNPQQRDEFIRSAGNQFGAIKARAEPLIGGYRDVAQDIGVVPERVVLPGAMVPDIDLEKPATQRAAASRPAAAQSDGGPRIVSVKGMKPGDLVQSLKEGETVRVPMGGGKYQTVRRKNGKLVKVKE